MNRVVRAARLVGVVWYLQLRMFAVSAFEALMQLIWPMIFATSAFLIFRVNGDRELLIFAGLGASAMGIWSAMATAASNLLQEERWSGTLELLVAAPAPLALVLAPVALAMATMGLLSMVVTLLWARFAFGISIPVADISGFLVSILVTIAAMAMLGFLLSVSVIRYRTSWALGNALEFPGWLLGGFFVPLAILPDWVKPLSYVFAPTWGLAGMRDAAAGRSPWLQCAICVALGVAYGVIGLLLSKRLLTSARRNATLSLT
ncbi:hypothetical protein GCM10029976_032520 [Kribbella albertanoniae]|uniref:ABC transporter permease n=1 Tax=Kribbella albertanoniae TaxID=1266829 RepID=A0A4R4QIM6_9ACTN|nr:ABC transporter permease [Kribbella albertanoniae]TDC35524.1 ABC transporter permease [Kribbella albertanoniae]